MSKKGVKIKPEKETSTGRKAVRSLSYTLLMLTSAFIAGILLIFLVFFVKSVNSISQFDFINKIIDWPMFNDTIVKWGIYVVSIAELACMLLLILFGRRSFVFKILMLVFFALFVFFFLFGGLFTFNKFFVDPAYVKNGRESVFIIPGKHQEFYVKKIAGVEIPKTNFKIDQVVNPLAMASGLISSIFTTIYFGSRKPKMGSSTLVTIGSGFSIFGFLFALIPFALKFIKQTATFADKLLPNGAWFMAYALLLFGLFIINQLLFILAGFIGLCEAKKN